MHAPKSEKVYQQRHLSQAFNNLCKILCISILIYTTILKRWFKKEEVFCLSLLAHLFNTHKKLTCCQYVTQHGLAGNPEPNTLSDYSTYKLASPFPHSLTRAPSWRICLCLYTERKLEAGNV